MKALITGINGFVGRYLTEHLLETGEWQVTGVVRQLRKQSDLPEQVKLQQADVRNQQAVHTALEQTHPDVIFHLAGQANVPRSFAEPGETLQTNTLPLLYLMLSALDLKLDPVILVVGSNEIYGHVTPEEQPVGESTPLRPVNPYAVSKAAQDLLAYQYYQSHGVRAVRLRPFNHIGPRQTEQYVASAFAAQIARIEAGKQEPLLRVGNLSAERDFTDVRDMVRAYALAATHGTPGAVYNIGSGRTESVRWMLDTMVGLSHSNIQIEPDPARMRPVDVPRVESDSRHFRAATGWKPQMSLEQTLLDILNYWRDRISAE